MTQRIVKFYGQAFSTTGDPVHILCKYNNIIVFDDVVTTSQVDVLPAHFGGTPIELFLFTTTMNLTGSIPIEVLPTGGKLFFVHLFMNFGITSTDVITGQPIYNLQTTDYVVPAATDVQTDGLSNPTLNGIDYSSYRLIDEAQNWADTHANGRVGPWTCPITDAHLFACDYFIDPNRTMFNQDLKEWQEWPLGLEL